MRLLIYEQWQDGHYYNYLEHIIPKVASIADEVIVCVTAQAYASDLFQRRFYGIIDLDNVTVSPELEVEDPRLPLRDRWRLLRKLYGTIALHKPDYVLVPSADGQHLVHGLLGLLSLGKKPANTPIEAIFHYNYGPGIKRVRDSVKGLLYRWSYLGSRWDYLNFVNAHYFDAAKVQGAPWVDKACLIPDPVLQPKPMTKAQARAMLGIPCSGKYIGFLGFLDGRNNIPQLLKAFTQARLTEDCRLLLAGRAPDDLWVFVNNHYRDYLESGRMIFINRFLSDTEVLEGYQALDVCCIPRLCFPGLSSLALKSIAARRPLLVHDFGWLGYMVKKFHLGHRCNMEKIDQFAAAIEQSVLAANDFSLSATAKRLLRFHSVNNFAEHIVYRMVSHFELPYEDKRLTWEWVTR